VANVGTTAKDGVDLAVTSTWILFHVYHMACWSWILGMFFELGNVDFVNLDTDLGSEYVKSEFCSRVFT
jgi:hypothetical protein